MERVNAGALETSPETLQAATVRSEVVATVRLAVPLALTQLGQIAMFTTDLALIGRLGDEFLAAGALAHTVLFAAFLVGMGLVSAVAPLTAQALGARDAQMVRRSLRVGIHAAILLSIPTVGLILGFAQSALVALGQDGAVAANAARYLTSLSWSLAPAWVFFALRGYMSAVGSAQPGLWIMAAAIPVNLALAYVLIFGAFGLPALGLVGAGIATSVVNTAMCVAGAVVVARVESYGRFDPLVRLWRPDWGQFGRLMAIGLPIAGAMSLEHGLFTASNLMAGAISVPALAAHQIALQVASIAFMLPLGIGMAASVRVGLPFGAGDAGDVRRAGFVALVLGAGVALISLMATVALANWLPAFFLGAKGPGNAATYALASALMVYAAAFFIVDGLQAVCAGVLRGINDTRAPMVFAALSFWGVGFPACWAMAFWLDWGTRGIWLGLLASLAVYAAFLIWRFERLSRTG